MGVPGLAKHFVNGYTRISIEELKKKKIILLIDLNQYIHLVADCNPEKNAKSVVERIVCLQKKINANQVFAAGDGIPPFAKIVQQRKRRYKSKYSKKKWNPTAVSPGTIFMKKFDHYFSEYASKYNLDFDLSTNQGEGEHKMFQYIDKIHLLDDTEIVMSSLDADFFSLCLRVPYYKKLFIFRESSNDYPECIVSVKRLWEHLKNPNWSDIKRQHYCAALQLLGNDFIPNIMSAYTRNKGTMSFLKKCVSKIEDTIPVNKSFFKKLFCLMSAYENTRVQRNAFYTKNVKQYEFLDELFASQFHFKKQYYYKIAGVTESDINNVCTKYLEGLLFVENYFTNHKTESTYFYPYAGAPLLIDYLDFDISLISDEIYSDSCSKIPEMFHLLYIIPPWDCHLLSELQQKHYNTFRKEHLSYFPSKCFLHHTFQTYDWEADILISLPEFNFYLKNAIFEESKENNK